MATCNIDYKTKQITKDYVGTITMTRWAPLDWLSNYDELLLGKILYNISGLVPNSSYILSKYLDDGITVSQIVPFIADINGKYSTSSGSSRLKIEGRFVETFTWNIIGQGTLVIKNTINQSIISTIASPGGITTHDVGTNLTFVYTALSGYTYQKTNTPQVPTYPDMTSNPFIGYIVEPGDGLQYNVYFIIIPPCDPSVCDFNITTL